jgi:hypothetical protein
VVTDSEREPGVDTVGRVGQSAEHRSGRFMRGWLPERDVIDFDDGIGSENRTGTFQARNRQRLVSGGTEREGRPVLAPTLSFIDVRWVDPVRHAEQIEQLAPAG